MKKKLLSAVLSASLLASALLGIGVRAAEVDRGVCGPSLAWTLDDIGTLTITGTGEMADFGKNDAAPWWQYREKISNLIVGDGVTTIGDNAFNNYDKLERVELGKGLLQMGDSAFYDSDRVSRIDMPEGLLSIGISAFESCDSLNRADIPKTVTFLGKRAYRSCRSLNTITIPGGIEYVDEETFYSCNALRKVVLEYGVERIGVNAFQALYNFHPYSNLISVTLPGSLKTIGVGAFANNYQLSTIAIPYGIEHIPNDAFNNCGLGTVYLPVTLESIGNSAFNGYNKLGSVFFGGSSAQWDDVSIGTDNEKLESATKYFSRSQKPATPAPEVTPETVPVPEGKVVLIYNANGGVEPPSPVTVNPNEAVTVSKEVLTRNEYLFLGWANTQNAKKPDYTGGEHILMKENRTLYAVWEKAGGYTVEIQLTIDKVEALLNGELVYNDVAPVIENSRTMLPARFVAESLGAIVGWDDTDRKVVITGVDGTVIEIFVDSTTALVNGESHTLDSPAFIRDARTYTPVRFICDNLGADVIWDETTRTVTISK